MSPKFQAHSLNHHLPSRIGSALLLLSLLIYTVAMIAPLLSGSALVEPAHWPQTLGSLLMLSVCGVPAGQYAVKGRVL